MLRWYGFETYLLSAGDIRYYSRRRVLFFLGGLFEILFRAGFISIAFWALCDSALPNREDTRMLVAAMASNPRLLIAQSHCNQHVLASSTELLSCVI